MFRNNLILILLTSRIQSEFYITYKGIEVMALRPLYVYRSKTLLLSPLLYHSYRLDFILLFQKLSSYSINL